MKVSIGFANSRRGRITLVVCPGASYSDIEAVADALRIGILRDFVASGTFP